MTQSATVIPEIPAEQCSSLLPALEYSVEREVSGLEVTPKAALLLREYLQGKDTLPIRIFLTIGGCGMQSFGISPEALQPADAVFKRDGFTCVVERRILKQYGPIKIDSDGFAFRLSGKGISPLTGCGTCAFQCGTRGGSRCTGVCVTCEAPCPTGLKIRSRRKQRKAAWL
ncbi:MAG: hypothetical protein VR65_22310 [Desulfobulbaceae bacterium BRH_c16a]|nr:MAG: hypothetical protein VR65_22310 [Desulfobulbaceae bacterium BRH_c16a]